MFDQFAKFVTKQDFLAKLFRPRWRLMLKSSLTTKTFVIIFVSILNQLKL